MGARIPECATRRAPSQKPTAHAEAPPKTALTKLHRFGRILPAACAEARGQGWGAKANKGLPVAGSNIAIHIDVAQYQLLLGNRNNFFKRWVLRSPVGGPRGWGNRPKGCFWAADWQRSDLRISESGFRSSESWIQSSECQDSEL